MIIEEIKTSMNENRWDDFVNEHPKGNIFQSSEMAKVYRNTKNYKPIRLAAFDDSDNLIALLQSVIIKETNSFIGGLTARSIVQGGPLYTDKIALLGLMNKYDEIVGKKAIYTQIRNQWDTGEIKNILEQCGYVFVDHFNAQIDLGKPIEKLWEQIERDKKRGIKNAEKNGITIEKCTSKTDIRIFYELLVNTYENAKIPIADISLFESVFDILVPDKKGLFLFANLNGKPIATQVALMDKNTIYAWYTGSDRNMLKYHPGDLLIWYLLKYGVENGFKTFDFGGGGAQNKNINLSSYKSRFGTNFQCYGRYEKIHSKVKKKVADAAFNIYKKLR